MKPMRTSLTRVNVDAFGRLGPAELELSPGLNVLFGENEAGKSTLQAFVRSVLFGFARKGAQRYLPATGGAFGGELHLATASGTVIARRVPKARRPEGELLVLDQHRAPLPQASLWEPLGHVSEALFAQVFSFSLDELRAFANLAQQSTVSEALFAAGTRGAQHLPKAMVALQDEAEALYGPRARGRPLNLAIEGLAHVRMRLAALDDAPARYMADRARLAAVEAALAAGGAQREQLRGREAHLERVLRAAPHALRLESLSAPDDVRLTAVEELAVAQGLEAQRRQAAQQRARIEAEQSAFEAQRSHAAADCPDPEIVALVEFSLEQELAVRPVAQGLAERTAALNERTASLRQALLRVTAKGRLHTLGAANALSDEPASVEQSPTEPDALPHLRAWLHGLDLGATSRARLTGWRDQAAQAAARSLRADETIERIATELAAIAGVAAHAQPADFEQRGRALRAIVDQARTLEDRRLRRDAAALTLAQQRLSRPAEPPAAPSVLTQVLIAVGGVMFAIGQALWGAGAMAAGAVIFSLCLAAAMAVWALEARRRWHVDDASAVDRVEVHTSLCVSLEQDHQTACISWAQASAAVDASLVATGLGAVDDAPEALRAHAMQEAKLGESRNAEQRRGQLTEQLLAARVAAQEAHRERDAVVAEDHARLVLGLCEVEPSVACELATELVRLQERSQELVDAEHALEADRHTVQQAQGHLAKAAAAAQVDERIGLVPALRRWRATAQEAKQAFTAAQHGLEALAGPLAAQRTAESQLSDELELLLARAQVDSLAELEALSARASVARAAGAERSQLRKALEAASGWSTAEAREAMALEPDASRALDECRRQAETLSAELERLAGEQGALAQRLAAAEADTSAAELRAEEEQLEAQVGRLAEQYAVAVSARQLLTRARARFETENQPRVVRLASARFAQLTAGRYPHLTVSQTGRTLEVHERTGARWTAEQLSRGTRELLLFSFHLALAQDFAEARVALPLLFDDVFVNLDSARLGRVVEALVEVAERHQVVLLTCHADLAGQLKHSGARVTQVAPAVQLSLLSP